MFIAKKTEKGFTLIELIVFVTILSTILVTMAGFTVSIHRRLKINSHKVMANFAGENLKEWLNSRRLSNWPELQAMATPVASPPQTYCANNQINLSDDISTVFTSGACSNYDGITGISPQIFKRELSLIKDPSGTVTSKITVFWLEDGVTYNVVFSSVYSFWQ